MSWIPYKLSSILFILFYFLDWWQPLCRHLVEAAQPVPPPLACCSSLPNSLGNLYGKTQKMLFVNNLTNYAFKNTQSVLLLCFLCIVYYSTEHWTHHRGRKNIFHVSSYLSCENCEEYCVIFFIFILLLCLNISQYFVCVDVNVIGLTENQRL